MTTLPRPTLNRRSLMAIGLALFVAACAKSPSDIDNQLAGANGAAVPGSAQDFVVNVGDRVLFDTDSASINAAAQATLDKQAQWLAMYPRYTATIEGHADERGTREYNLALGARRARATLDYLVARGVAPTRLKTISYGKERPVALCDAAPSPN
jgi:peptidoglycan-associated lipoprotein